MRIIAEMKISAAPKPKISLSDFHLIKKIGKGSFGEVTILLLIIIHI
jgi:hypothetical protein